MKDQTIIAVVAMSGAALTMALGAIGAAHWRKPHRGRRHGRAGSPAR